jgi:hypothetical protein
VLTTRSPGYVIRVEPDELDLHRFERLVDEGRSLLARGLAADPSERLRDALSLWRGSALADFAYESFAHPQATPETAGLPRSALARRALFESLCSHKSPVNQL